MNLVIPDEILQQTHLSTTDFKREVAFSLWLRRLLTIEQAGRIADMPAGEFETWITHTQLSSLSSWTRSLLGIAKNSSYPANDDELEKDYVDYLDAKYQ